MAKIDEQSLKMKVAIVTGSSRGIGLAIAKKFAKQNFTVVLNSRDESRLDLAKKEVFLLTNSVFAVAADVSTIDGSRFLIDQVLKKFGRIDILVNNVGISSRGKVADLNPEVFKIVFESNVYGSVYPTIAALPSIRLSKGSIVFVSSLAGIRGLPWLAPYSSSKLALRAIAESIRIEEAENEVHVGLVLVGITEIVHNKEAVSADGKRLLLSNRDERKVLTVEEVASSVLKNIKSRRYITTMTKLGKLNAFLQARFPLLVEKIILMNLNKFEERNK
jgi:NAD(P)-dependent dehydrogenase (short-subunit alcohol dehydrogenase family)